MNNNWIIAGFTGAGKTTALDYVKELDQKQQIFKRAMDLDKSFESKYCHPSLYIKKFGFEDFRLKEFELLKDELGKSENQLISLGGGALHEKSFKHIKSQSLKILGIDSPFDDCWERIRNDDTRPISHLEKGQVMKLFQSRQVYWLNADYLVHNNRGYQDFLAALKDWYSCQAAAGV